MSNKISALVYSRKIGSTVRKAVLAYFADRASDDGTGIWAAKSTIADAIECGRSTVIRTINELVAEGILKPVGTRRVRTGATIEYAIALDLLEALPPSKGEASTNPSGPAAGPLPERDPSRSGTLPVPERDPHPSRSGTQTILRTINEPPNTESAPESAVEILAKVASREAARSFTTFRQRMRKPLTSTAAHRIAADLVEIDRRGGSATDALGLAEERGWQAVKPEWYFKQESRSHEQTARTDTHPNPARRDHRAAAADDAFEERIAFAAANRSPSRPDFGFGRDDP